MYRARFFEIADEMALLLEAHGFAMRLQLIAYALRIDPRRKATHCALLRAYAAAGQLQVPSRQCQLLGSLLLPEGQRKQPLSLQ